MADGSAARVDGPACLPLLYHELRPLPSGYTYALTCADFATHLDLFANLKKKQPQALSAEITFDDGHRSNFQYALPLLEERSLRARFFITAGWTGVRSGYMDWAELRALQAAGHDLGAHGWSHALLTHVSGAERDRELRGARQSLEDGLGRPITSLSLPGGRFDRAVLEACRDAGYERIWTSIPRAENLPFGAMVGRLNVRSDATAAFLETLLQPGSRALRRLERQSRVKGLAKSVLGDTLYARFWSMLNGQEKDSADAGGDAQ